MGNGRDMQQQIGAAAKGRMYDHCVVERVFCENVGGGAPIHKEVDEGLGRTLGKVKPNGLAGGGQS